VNSTSHGVPYLRNILPFVNDVRLFSGKCKVGVNLHRLAHGTVVNVGYAFPLGKAGPCLTTELRTRNLYRAEPFKTARNHSIEKARTVSKGNKGHNQLLSRFRALNDPVFEENSIPFSSVIQSR